jgi:hypothetical protein
MTAAWVAVQWAVEALATIAGWAGFSGVGVVLILVILWLHHRRK